MGQPQATSSEIVSRAVARKFVDMNSLSVACNMSAPPAVNHQLNMQSAPPNVAHGHQWTSSANNTTWHHPRQLELGPQPRHSVASSGARTDGNLYRISNRSPNATTITGADIIYRTAKRAPLTKYAGASYVRETDGAPVETVCVHQARC